jgi:L-ascorbate metabolism protein UlaG (beta-lactamase superfamily)
VWLRKLGHSCLLAEEANTRLLIDPGCLSEGFEDLSGLTGILISHIHDDHLDIDRLFPVLERNPGVRVLCDEASAAALHERGVTAEVVRAGDALDLGVPVSVYGHDHAVIHPDLPNVPTSGTCWLTASFSPETLSPCQTSQLKYLPYRWVRHG